MILVVNLNLAVDHVLEVPGFAAGGVFRAACARRQPGGKGVNVARVLGALGEACVVAGFLGGASGREIARGLRAEAIPIAYVRTRGESRTCVILEHPDRGGETVVNEQGPAVGAGELARFVRLAQRLAAASEIVIVTGSLPPGLPVDTYARLVEIATEAGARVLVDCAGEPLRAAIAARPFVVKVNDREAAALLGRPVARLDDARRAADRLRAMGAASAMVTRGPRAAVLRTSRGGFRLTPPAVAARNAVGSGDACLAGIAAALRRGRDLADAGRLGVASGSASALHGFGRCTAAEIVALLDRVGVARE